MTWFGNQVTLKDGPQLDGFSRLRVSMPTTLFDSQQEYGLDTRRTWDAVVYNGSVTYSASSPSAAGSVSDASGNAVGPRNANSRMTPITVSANNTHYAILQSRQYTRYIPGKSHLVFITGVFASGANTTAKFVLRTSTSGSVSDSNNVDQTSWNIDPMDGTGPSGKTLDLTKTQILFIQAQWLGVGRVIVGFDIDGMLYPCHEFLNANVLAVPYTQTFNLPVRLEAQCVASSTTFRVGYFDLNNGVFLETTRAVAGGTFNFVCCSVQSEGGDEMRGSPRTANNGIAGLSLTTTSRVPVLSIRPAATYQGLTNRAHIEQDEVLISISGNSALWEVVVGGTLTGAAFATAGTDSCAEYDTAATAISGGITVVSGYVISGGAPSSRSLGGGDADLRNPLVLSQINALTATQTPLTLCATKFTGANATINAGMNWHEQTI